MNNSYELIKLLKFLKEHNALGQYIQAFSYFYRNNGEWNDYRDKFKSPSDILKVMGNIGLFIWSFPWSNTAHGFKYWSKLHTKWLQLLK